MTTRPVEPASRATLVLTTLGALAVAAALLLNPAQIWRAMQFEGKPAPAISLPSVGTAQSVSLDQYKGQVIVLDFWATWCPPCVKQMPIIQKLDRDPALKGQVKLISVNVDEAAPDRDAKVLSFLARRRLSMTALQDDGTAWARYKIKSIPTLVVIDPSGQVVTYHQGLLSEQKLREMIAEASKS